MADGANNQFLNRLERTKNLSNSHRRSKVQEKELSIRLSARQVAASGAREVKGDLRIKGFARIEVKTTKNKSFSVTLDMVQKIEDAATSTGEMPVLIVEFNDGFNRKLKECAIMPMYALQTLLDGQAK